MSAVSGLTGLPATKALPGNLMGKQPLSAHSVSAVSGGGCSQRSACPGCGWHTHTCVSTLGTCVSTLGTCVFTLGGCILAHPCGEGPWLRTLSGVPGDLLVWGLEVISSTPTRYSVLFLSHPSPSLSFPDSQIPTVQEAFARSSPGRRRTVLLSVLIQLKLSHCFPCLP